MRRFCGVRHAALLQLVAGWLRVAVQGVAGRSLDDCKPLVGDSHWAQITWQGGADLGVAPNQPVTLQFALYQAKLFGLQFD